ncbi:hypothetical protein EV359DRAFT_68389 [Lentinula novae-zelandiae]|nr:hypothetical protein EV359DRAFT_68389 [Lentinula novae-zelandiae]
MQRIIHSEDTLEMLECAVDLRFNQGKDRVSLWVLGLWQKLSTTCKYQENWRDAYTTVEQVVKDPIVAVEFPTAEHVFGCGDKEVEAGGSLPPCFTANPCLKLWFQALQHKHEVVFCIDFGESTIAYGRQYIVYSRHGIFGDKLWEHDHRFLEQLVWFTTLVPDIVKEPILSNLLNPAQEVAYCDILEAVEAEVEGLDGPEYEISTSKALYEQPTAEPPPVSDDSKKPNKLTSAWASFGFATQTLPGKTSKKRTADFKVNDSESKKQNTGRMLSGSQVGTSKSNQSTKTLREKVKAGIYDLVK